MAETAASSQPEKWVGQSVLRKEDKRLLRGKGQFIDDIKLAGMHHAAVLRSPYPHAKIKNIDTSRARELAGVKAVVTYADTPGIKFGPRSEDWTIFAADRARFHGDEVAAVAAIDEDTAEEALELIEALQPFRPGFCPKIGWQGV